MNVELHNYFEQIKNSNSKNIIIYGAGKVGTRLYELCLEQKINITLFCVTNLEHNLKEVKGVKVCAFNQLETMGYHPEDTLILIGVKELGESKIGKMLKDSKWKKFIPLPNYNIVEDYDRLIRPEMEITTKIGCSVNCKYCPQKNLIHSYFKSNSDRKIMFSLEDFKICLDKLPSNTLVDFAGFGEPFLNPDAIELMEYACNKGFEITLYTTLVGLQKENLNRVLAIPFKEVVLHVADNEGFAAIPVTEEYLYLLDAFLNEKKADGTLFVDDVNCQCTPHPEVIKKTKGRYKVYRELMDRAGNLVGDEYKDLIKADKHGPIICMGMKELNHNILLPDGTVVLCCNDFSLQHVLGNLLEQSYSDIMNSTIIKNIKQAMLNDDGSKTLLCRKCAYAKEL